MLELIEKSVRKTDTAYRALSKDMGDYVIDLGDLFRAVEADNQVRRPVAKTFTSPPPHHNFD